MQSNPTDCFRGQCHSGLGPSESTEKRWRSDKQSSFGFFFSNFQLPHSESVSTNTDSLATQGRISIEEFLGVEYVLNNYLLAPRWRA